MTTRVKNQLKKCSMFLHTGLIESYHSLCLMYASKETQFSYSGMVLRTILAVLDHNSNIGRAKIGTKWVYSNAKKTMVEKKLSTNQSLMCGGKSCWTTLLFSPQPTPSLWSLTLKSRSSSIPSICPKT